MYLSLPCDSLAASTVAVSNSSKYIIERRNPSFELGLELFLLILADIKPDSIGMELTWQALLVHAGSNQHIC